MTGGPFSAERRTGSLRLFGLLAVVAGPAVIVLAVVFALGGGSSDEPGDDLPMEFRETVAAGEELMVAGASETWVLWGTPADVDLASVQCADGSGELEVDGAPQVEGAAPRTDENGAAWTRLVDLGDDGGTVTCSGGGLTQVGLDVQSEGVSSAKGGTFFGVFGVAATLLGLVALRLSRRRS